KALPLIHDVAELVERPRRRWIEGRGRPEIAGGLFDFAAALVGLGPAKVREHRLGAQRDRAAVRLEGYESLVAAEGGVAPRQERAVIAFAGRRVVRQGGDDGGQHDESCNEERAAHAAIW